MKNGNKTAQPPTPTNLTELPAEILHEIGTYLSLEDLLSLRATSRFFKPTSRDSILRKIRGTKPWPIKQIAAGREFSLLLTDEGNVWCCGSNFSGQLGIGTFTATEVQFKKMVEVEKPIKQMAAGAQHIVLLAEDGSVYVSGRNMLGQLGINGKQDQSLPQKLKLDKPAKQVAAASDHTLLLLEDGSVLAFGENLKGQLGLGNKENQRTPALVKLEKKVKQVATGLDHSLFLMEDNTLLGCGLNFHHQLGPSLPLYNYTPVLLPLELNQAIKQMACGDNHTVLLMEDSTAILFGCNSAGELGIGHSRPRSEIVHYQENAVKQVAAGRQQTVFLLGNNQALVAGDNRFGQLALHYQSEKQPLFTIAKIEEPIKQVAVGGFHILFLLERGTVLGYGFNYFGQLARDPREIENVIEPTILAETPKFIAKLIEEEEMERTQEETQAQGTPSMT